MKFENVLRNKVPGLTLRLKVNYHSLLFKIKCTLDDTATHNTDPFYFSWLKSETVNHDRMDMCKIMLSGLIQDFTNQFTVFTQLENDFSLLCSLFTCDASDELKIL